MLKSYNSAGKKVYLVVPQQFVLNTDNNLLNLMESKALINIKVKSFSTLIREVLSTVGGRKKQVITESGQILFTKIAIKEALEDLDLYRKSSKETSFAKLLHEQISDFKDSGITPEILENIADEEEGDFREKLLEISKIYKIYEEKLDKGYKGLQEKMDLMNESLEKMEAYRDTIFVFDKFSYVNSYELETIEILQGMTKVFMTLVIDPMLLDDRANIINGKIEFKPWLVKNRDIFKSTEYLYDKIANLQLSTEILESGQYSELDHIADSIFSYSPDRLKTSPKHCSISSYKNTYEEVGSLLLNIKYLVQKGARYRDINVITTDFEEYNPIIRRVFKDQIPFFMDEDRSIKNRPFSKFIIASLKLLDTFNIDDIIVFLKSGFMGINIDEVNSFHAYVKSRKIKGSMIFDDKYFNIDEDFERKHKEEDLREIETAIEVRNKFLDFVGGKFNLKARIKENKRGKEKTVKEYAREFYKFLGDDRIQDALDKFEASFDNGEKDLEKYEEHRQIWDQIMDSLDELVDIAGDISVTFSEFADMFMQYMDLIKVSIIPPSQDLLVVGNLSRTISEQKKYLFVLGMNDLFIPKRSGNTKLLSDGEIKKFEARNYLFPSMANFTKSTENLTLYNAIRKCAYLHFSYANISSQNLAMNKTYLLDQVEKSMNFDGDNYQPIKYESFLYDPNRLKSFVAHSLSKGEKEGNAYEFSKKVFNFYRKNYENAEFAKAYQDISFALRSKEPKKNLSRDLSKRIYADKTNFSPSELEKYNACPYSHFVNYGLRLREETSLDIDGRERGNILHKSLENVMKDYKYYFDVFGQEEFFNKSFFEFDKASKDVLDKQKLISDRNKFFLDLLKDKYREVVEYLVGQLKNSNVVKIDTELKFSKNFNKMNNLPAIELKVDDETFTIEGKIDRLDYFLEDGISGVRVIDYKTAREEFDLSLAISGIKIQLVLYLDAAKKISKPLGAFYLPIGKDEFAEDESEESISKLAKNSYLMSGFLIDDLTFIEAMDNSLIDSNMEEKYSSIEFKGRKRSILDKNNVIREEQIITLIDKIEESCKNAIREIREGKIEVKPYKNTYGSACKYCKYKIFCTFDPDRGDSYRFIENYKYEDLNKSDDLGKEDRNE